MMMHPAPLSALRPDQAWPLELEPEPWPWPPFLGDIASVDGVAPATTTTYHLRLEQHALKADIMGGQAWHGNASVADSTSSLLQMADVIFSLGRHTDVRQQ